MKEETHKIILNGLSAHEGNLPSVAILFLCTKEINTYPSIIPAARNLSVNWILSLLIGLRKVVALTGNIYSA